jgi:hypothetical protein
VTEKFVYTGPSWAARSYDPPGTPEFKNPTNLAKEWQIPFFDVSNPGTTVLNRIDAVKKLDNTTLPIVWVYNEPIKCLTEATGLSNEQIIQRSDWRDIWEDCNQFCLKAINDLNRPVLLIGAHSDIVNCDYKNITVAHPSWQKFLANQAGMPIKDNTVSVKMDDGGDFFVSTCWGAEVLHKFMHENSHITPSAEVTNAVWDIFFFWKELEKSNLFFEVHPNHRGNKLFAEHLTPTVIKFLQENK